MAARWIRASVVAALLALISTACGGQPGAPSGITPSASATATEAQATPTAPPTAAPTPAGGIVTSARFGYSLEIPPGWVHRPATEDWPERTYPSAGAPYTDNWERLPGGFPVIDVSTQVLPADQSQDQFMTDLDAGNTGLGCTAESTEEVTVDGAVGRFQRQLCFSGAELALEVAVFDGDRVYLIYWIGFPADRAEDEAAFRQILASFRFATAGS